MAVVNYVRVSTDPTDLVIREGPILGMDAPDTSTRLIREDAALAAGYTYPAAGTDFQRMQTLLTRARNAVAANNTFLTIASPTAAQVRDQVILLTKECTALIRLAASVLDTTDGTT